MAFNPLSFLKKDPALKRINSVKLLVTAFESGIMIVRVIRGAVPGLCDFEIESGLGWLLGWLGP